MAASTSQPSAPFLSREFNGEVLIEELNSLRRAHVSLRHLSDCVNCLRQLEGAQASEAAAEMQTLATRRFADQPALGALLSSWAAKLKADIDVSRLASHFERLAVTFAVVGVAKQVADRLPARGRG